MEFKRIREEKAVDTLISLLSQGDYKKASVKLGEQMGEPQEFMKLFGYLTKGSRLEGVKVRIDTVPLKAECDYCDWTGKPELPGKGPQCPRCKRDARLLQGNELQITL